MVDVISDCMRVFVIGCYTVLYLLLIFVMQMVDIDRPVISALVREGHGAHD